MCILPLKSNLVRKESLRRYVMHRTPSIMGPYHLREQRLITTVAVHNGMVTKRKIMHFL